MVYQIVPGYKEIADAVGSHNIGFEIQYWAKYFSSTFQQSRKLLLTFNFSFEFTPQAYDLINTNIIESSK